MAKLIQVIETLEPRGGGTSGDPCRLVTRYYSTDGQLLAENDPFDGSTDTTQHIVQGDEK